ncbi:hypothetical protein T09_3686 [Trichinella sp. T9]|nr:hypothetical protein T09_3686 [Trichinella sp. T9]
MNRRNPLLFDQGQLESSRIVFFHIVLPEVHVIRSHANTCVYKENEKLVEREEEATVDWGKSVHLLSYKKKELLCI